MIFALSMLAILTELFFFFLGIACIIADMEDDKHDDNV